MRWPTLEVEAALLRVVGRRVVLVVEERVAGTRHVPRPHSRPSSPSRGRWVYLPMGHRHHVVPTLHSFVRAFYLPYLSYHQGLH